MEVQLQKIYTILKKQRETHQNHLPKCSHKPMGPAPDSTKIKQENQGFDHRHPEPKCQWHIAVLEKQKWTYGPTTPRLNEWTANSIHLNKMQGTWVTPEKPWGLAMFMFRINYYNFTL